METVTNCDNSRLAMLLYVGDAVACALGNYVCDEKLNPSTKESIERLVENFTIVQDYREITVSCHYRVIVWRSRSA